ncbi:AzlD domain-containing protein [Streptomyces sp. Lzd4kr]|nr:AzlD domain-containing protein [Streptomyces sp. Lzd4kr]
MNAWLTVMGAGLVMFLLKAVVPLAMSRRELPERVIELSRLVAPAVVAALLAASLAHVPEPAVLIRRTTVLICAFIVALRTQSVPKTLTVGLAVHALFHLAA